MSEHQPKRTKKKYSSPEIKPMGSLRDITQTSSKGGAGDGGAFPMDRRGSGGGGGGGNPMCVTSPPVLDEHRHLLADVAVQDRYRRSIERFVKPGDVVLDLGSGSGLHALFALRAGASKVYALEMDPYMARMIEGVAQRNGFMDRLQVVVGESQSTSLPERVDVIVSNVGFLESVKALPDAVERFLKADGRVLPSGVRLGFAAHSDRRLYEHWVGFWNQERFGFDFSDLAKQASGQPFYFHLDREHLASAPQRMPVIEWQSGRFENFNFTFDLRIDRTTEITGLSGFYEFLVGQETLISTLPPHDLSDQIWRNFYLPFERPVTTQEGDLLRCNIFFDPHARPNSSVWAWSVSAGGEIRKGSNLESVLP